MNSFEKKKKIQRYATMIPALPNRQAHSKLHGKTCDSPRDSPATSVILMQDSQGSSTEILHLNDTEASRKRRRRRGEREKKKKKKKCDSK